MKIIGSVETYKPGRLVLRLVQLGFVLASVRPVCRRRLALSLGPRSSRLDVRTPDHRCPLLRIIGDEFPEVGGRSRSHVAVQVGKP